jgi:hypothetical protein
MAEPDLAVVAEGDLPSGQHWIVRAGGTAEDFYTVIATIHPDGHSDEGGMGGPPLYPGSVLNVYTGAADGGLRRVLLRADRRVARVLLRLENGEQLMLAPLGTWPEVGVTFFAALLPRTADFASATAVDADGAVLE